MCIQRAFKMTNQYTKTQIQFYFLLALLCELTLNLSLHCKDCLTTEAAATNAPVRSKNGVCFQFWDTKTYPASDIQCKDKGMSLHNEYNFHYFIVIYATLTFIGHVISRIFHQVPIHHRLYWVSALVLWWDWKRCNARKYGLLCFSAQLVLVLALL